MWLAKDNGNVKDTQITNYDLYIYDEDMNLITKQNTNDDCLELAEFTVSKAGTYKVEII